jgi:hypothetical protein
LRNLFLSIIKNDFNISNLKKTYSFLIKVILCLLTIIKLHYFMFINHNKISLQKIFLIEVIQNNFQALLYHAKTTIIKLTKIPV